MPTQVDDRAPMIDPPCSRVIEKLDELRTELADLAFDLERHGRLDAADATNSAYARVGALRKRLVDVLRDENSFRTV